jgi:ketosteroid isomerase-like protein
MGTADESSNGRIPRAVLKLRGVLALSRDTQRNMEILMEKDDTQGALDSFRSYAQAFQSLDANAVAGHFHEPALLITPYEVAALRTTAEIEQAYARIMADLPAHGYAGTEFSTLDARRLSDDLAIVTGRGVWKRATGEEFAPFGMTYTLRRVGGTWRIVVAAIYPKQSALMRAGTS